MDKSLIKQHTRIAMGEDDAVAETKGMAKWPGLCPPERDEPLTRGEGRAPDARKSGMPSSDPTRKLWLDTGDKENTVTVKEHTRTKPNGQMGYE